MTALSILDLVRVTEDDRRRGALDNARDLAAHAENWGYRRFWVAEHHNMPGIASAATSVVIGYIAGGTKKIRVGAGGIMLPNHAPLVIAEQFGTLARLFPGRIDLGLGRAPGTDQCTVRAMRRSPRSRRQLPAGRARAAGLSSRRPGRQRVQAVPAAGTEVPLWILGSSTYRRAARRRARPALCLRLAFCAGPADAGAPDLPQPLQAIASSSTGPTPWSASTSSPPKPTTRPPAGDDAADVVRQYLPR